jgi:hypothetical protein
MGSPRPPQRGGSTVGWAETPQDADAAYPEVDGYADFVAEQGPHLESYCRLRDNKDIVQHLQANVQLMEGSEHVGRWFMLRHSDALTRNDGKEILAEAKNFFLFDAACDAANHDYLMRHGDTHVTSREDLRNAARAGVQMLYGVLRMPGTHPIEQGVQKRSREYVGLIIKRVAKLKEQAKEEEQQREEQRKREREAAARMQAEQAKLDLKRARERRLSPTRIIIMLLTVFGLATVFGLFGGQ